MNTSRLEADEELVYPVPKSRHVWLQVARGSVAVNGIELHQGDGITVSDEDKLEISSLDASRPPHVKNPVSQKINSIRIVSMLSIWASNASQRLPD